MRWPDIAQRLYKGAQLLFQFDDVDLKGGTRSPSALVKTYAAPPPNLTSSSARPIHLRGPDHDLEFQARELLRSLGAEKLAREIRVEWNPRLKTCAGRADYRGKLISLNPVLPELCDIAIQTQPHFDKLDRLNRSSFESAAENTSKKIKRHAVVRDEIDRTLRHELAHLLAQFRAGRRRIAPHGIEWRQACRDLGIADEARCHNLPFTTKVYQPRYVYRCPNCKAEFPRVRRIHRAIACLACCRAHNGGEFDVRFRLRLIRSQQKETKNRENSSSFTLLSSV